MSRTWHHGQAAKRRLYDNEAIPGLPTNITPRKKKRNIDTEWHWMNTPSWWIREMMTRPQRAEVRACIYRTLKCDNMEDAPLFPLTKKPHIYYW